MFSCHTFFRRIYELYMHISFECLSAIWPISVLNIISDMNINLLLVYYMASFFVRNNTSGSSFKSISGATSRKEASDFNWLSNQFDAHFCQ